jgi:hypothetical protein
MAFSFGAFARGFAQAAVEDKREKEEEVRDLIKTSYASTLEEAKVLRERRRKKREDLKSVGNQLKLMNLNDSQVAGILSTGVDGAKRQLEILQAAAEKYGPDFNVDTFVTASEESNLTMDDAIDRIMGTPVARATEAKIPEAAQVKTIFGTTDKAAREQLERLEGAFGEDFASLQAETADREYGELPQVSIDYSQLGMKTPDEETAQKIKDLQLQKLEAEIADIGKPDDLTASQEQSLVRGMNNILAPLVAKQFDTELTWDGSNYVLPRDADDRAQAAMSQALNLARQGVENIKSGNDYTTAIGIQQGVIRNLQYNPNMTSDVTPDEVITPDDVPIFDSTQGTANEFVTSMAQQLGVAGMNETDKKNARETIRKALLSGDQTMSVVQANKIINRLIP